MTLQITNIVQGGSMKGIYIIAIATSITWGGMIQAQSYSWNTSNQAKGQPIAAIAATHDSAMQGQHTTEYWTTERLRNAKHIDLPRATESYTSSEILYSYGYEWQNIEPDQAPTIKVKRNKPMIMKDSL